MTNIHHTPGPWECGKGYGLHGVEIVGDGGNRMVCGVIGVTRDQNDRDGRKVGEIQTPDGWANVHLIAAAPDMRAALERQVANIDRWLETGEPADEAESKSIYEQMVAAIARATGGQS